MSEKPPEPNLDPVEIRQFRQAIEEFNSGKFFECHDTLEEIWRGIRGPARVIGSSDSVAAKAPVTEKPAAKATKVKKRARAGAFVLDSKAVRCR